MRERKRERERNRERVRKYNIIPQNLLQNPSSKHRHGFDVGLVTLLPAGCTPCWSS
jgi:hypothetical protein